MSTATHYPESGFKAGYNWPQTVLQLSGVPGTLANWQSFTALSGTDLTNLGTDNASGVSTECYFVGGETSYTYAGGVASRFTISDGTVSQLDITIKGVDDGGDGYSFFAYNFHTSAWVSIGTHTGGAPTTFTFTASITSNPGYYLDGSNHMWLLSAASEYDADTNKLTLFMRVVDTFTGGTTDAASTCAGVTTAACLGAATFNGAATCAAATTDAGAGKLTRNGAATCSGATSDAAAGKLTCRGAATCAGATSAACAGIRSMPGAAACAAATAAACQGALTRNATATCAGATTAVCHGVAARSATATCAGVTVASCQGAAPGTPATATCAGVTSAACQGALTIAGEAQCVGVTVAVATGALTVNADATCAAVTEALCAGTMGPFGQATCAGVTDAACTGHLIVAGSSHCAAATAAACAGRLLSGTWATCAGSTVATCAGVLSTCIFLSLPTPGVCRLSWSRTGTIYLVMDGVLVATTTLGYVDVGTDQAVRAVLLALAALPPTLPGPRDEVLLNWTGDAEDTFTLERRAGMGAFAVLPVGSMGATSYLDGPLEDGTYGYQVTASDAEGDTATSAEFRVTVSSVPDPPSALGYTWDADTQTLTLTWAASPSADAASYRVRSSAGVETLALSSAPVEDSASLTYVQTFTNETGLWIFSVRTVDTDGNEEQNISQVLAIPFKDGVPAAMPVEPDSVYAAPVAGGCIEVGCMYRPWRELPPGTGAAFEARIYWDAGTGTMDWSAPTATVAMAGPLVETAYTWTSAALTSGTEYAFVVRIASAAWPAGIETQNADQHAAEAGSGTAPTTPILTAQVV